MIFTEAVRTATVLANHGDFNAAIGLLGDRWRGIGIEPARQDDGDLEFAHLLLACGILAVRMGKFATQCQAEAKDLLSKSVRLFGEDSGKYEALFWLATAYSFCGEHKEALTLADSIVADQKADIDVEFSAGILRGYTYMSLGDYNQAEAAFGRVEGFVNVVSPLCSGKFYLTRGVLFRQMGRLSDAISDYQTASLSFTLANSPRYLAAAENNSAGALTELGRYDEARSAASSALRVFSELQDRAHEAKVWDQLARIYEREENYAEMVSCADRAVEILSTGDHEGWLAEALITQGTARARLGLAEANSALTRALEICERQGDPKQAAAATKAMWEIVQRGRETRDGLRAAVAPFEKDVYERTLERHHGRVSPAARELGLHHQVFQKRLRTRFPELLAKRTPAVRRHKSLMKHR